MSEANTIVAASAPPVWGLLAEFDSVDALLAACTRVREDGYVRFDAHSPFPVHGLDEAVGIRMSKLPWLVAGGGAVGAATALAMQFWMNGLDYPYVISGKPLFGLPAAIPITFELTVLLASLAAFVGLWWANGAPQFYHPVLPAELFERGTTDRFFIAIEATDPRFDPLRTKALLETVGAVRVATVEA
ncbi:MAG: DUF3341 domain-containing protein [Thermoanaerobaculales bacterium]